MLVFLLSVVDFDAQNSTFSPYSRYGLGELYSPVLAHNAGMGGAFAALKPDSTVPVFINTGNPAAYALIKLTTLEVGGRFQYSNLKSSGTSFQRYTTNFTYGALGFPIRGNGGACFGIMPYSHVGYETQNTSLQPGVGTLTFNNQGTGGLNRAFLGYGIMPFSKLLRRFRHYHLYIADSLKTMSRPTYKLREFGCKLLSDVSIGANAAYLFGDIEHTTRVIYPNSVLYNNTLRLREMNMGAFTGNFGAQTALTFDSVRTTGGKRRALKEKVKITLGFYTTFNHRLNVSYSSLAYNYIVNSSGQETMRDTAYRLLNQSGQITLPVEQGFGLGFKKGERLNIVADFATTAWKNFKYLDDVNDFKDNYRVSVGFNYVPEKYAGGRGSFYRRVNYRAGVSYNSGYIQVNNKLISDYQVSLGLGIPVGASRYVSSMVNVALHYGQVAYNVPGVVKDNYFRVSFGFTFSDRWFQKFRYD